MRHKYAGYKLKRDVAGRNSLLRNLATSIIEGAGSVAAAALPEAAA